MVYREDLSLVAIQGPGAMAAVQKLVPSGVDLTKVHLSDQHAPLSGS
jgi:glycine cleavage system aminomethyltransferase T